MARKLSNEAMKRQLQEGRNYKQLYLALKTRFDGVVAENKQLRQENATLKAHFAEVLEAQAARIEELEAMVFGRKPKGGQPVAGKHKPKAQRPASSYRRPIPTNDEVTKEYHHPIDVCRRCGGPLTDKAEHVRFVEDIVLAALSNLKLKTVEKHSVERGWCTRCGQYRSTKDLRGQDVSLGPNVRILVTYLSNLQGLTYSQIQMLLMDLYGFAITDGEITAILDDQRLRLLPTYEELKAHIRDGPAHFDESRFRIQSEQNKGFAWLMASAESSDVVFHLSDNRGQGNAEALSGENFTHVGITDRYSVYKHLFALHQICWAHLHTTAKGLTQLESLTKAKRRHVRAWYEAFSGIYAQVRQYHEQPYDVVQRQTQADELLEAVKDLCKPHRLDPKKLTDLKAGMLEYQNALFICLIQPGIPPDNNQAEQHMRKLVLKRHRSFGVKTPKGARTLEVLLSVSWSLWHRDRANFFPNLLKLTRPA